MAFGYIVHVIIIYRHVVSISSSSVSSITSLCLYTTRINVIGCWMFVCFSYNLFGIVVSASNSCFCDNRVFASTFTFTMSITFAITIIDNSRLLRYYITTTATPT